MSKAMVIDDSKTIRLILSRTLSELGYDVAQAANGREGLAALQGSGDGIGLILVDWNMPEMNGLDFVKSVRSDHRYDEIKLMMVTTETQVEQMLAALEAGANEYVMKPFTREVIEDKLRLMGVLQ
ncbi:MAG: response regulator [Bryobacterales bacterium]|nr:response regulator [Bryobacterales bacterium]